MVDAKQFRYNSKINNRKVAKNLGVDSGVIYLKGHVNTVKFDSDTEMPFDQDPYFFYMTGVEQPGYEFLYDIGNDKAILFAPRIPEDDIVWIGMPETNEELKERYDVDEVRYADTLTATVKELSPKCVHVLANTDTSLLGEYQSGADDSKLLEALQEARMFKSEFELEIMRISSKISSEAHVSLMKSIKPGMNERELQALFEYECNRRGSMRQSYLPIMAYSKNAATLHYGRNNCDMPDGNQLFLVDAGGEYHRYASDITRTFPVGGKYTDDAKTIYSIVLDMQKQVLAALKPGVQWEDMHRLASRIACEGLIKCGILKGDVEELIAHYVPAAFYPHGLGHSIGIDTHDVGGYPKGVERINEPGIRYLRMRRELKPGMVVTVEPGIYFCDAIIEPFLKDPKTAKFFDIPTLDRFRKVGGVRIEDNVVIKEDSIENLTTAPKEIAEIEAIMASA
ncbi:hypothetical protein K493DRAFT_221107 [Basidiobolus meristosporus CBS 931.73]|uniref:Aminopeptidase P N-terminal domain-containing protein n=1 Tax=Basidiobolus meristosporus CBS 931.73 TaxID=1314790 RepID=A0A1Y1YAA8_9FUNG|nr:hypothetical protein K493DRAFT_221107 [Basidiobolus meristosporus CBS 931.73]|eukprot:ORX94534.1 hypothetical protein K493DRAFT_221107 [Basidiobolus meristosporus CBS 931.73]